MMLARAYKDPEDFDGLKDLCHGDMADLDPGKDVIVVVESEGRIVGSIAIRPMLLIHCLAVEPSLGSHKVAEILSAYEMGAARTMGHREALMVVDEDNLRARRFVEGQKAKKVSGVTYILEVR
jgi:N-acetylglutamate synthase-like GNAT family acetyltransferase